MKQIKIHFEDYGKRFDKTEEVILKVLRRSYDVVIDPRHPDYLFYSCGGYNHLKYNSCIKIFYTCENIEPDFNLCDYAIAHPHLQYGDRYLRAPYYLFSPEFEPMDSLPIIDPQKALNRKFCNFIYSSGWADPFREVFFRLLSSYKPIDSGGRILNNMGGLRVSDKMSFIKNYKFTIAFENSCLPGYTTEKIVEAMSASSLPIYWGNPDIAKDFNRDAFVCLNDYKSPSDAVNEIIRLDADDAAYLRKLSAPRFTGANYPAFEEDLYNFLRNIIDRPLTTAKRTSDYGFVYSYRRDMTALRWLFSKNKTIGRWIRKLLRLMMGRNQELEVRN
jgi:hypothetical protein